MTPKDKAKELVDRFIPHTRVWVDGWEDSFRDAKQCAIIAVRYHYEQKIEEAVSIRWRDHYRHELNEMITEIEAL